MKTFKRIDCVLQAVLIVLGIGMAIASGEILSELFFAAYFIVGGWQVLSAIVHLFYRAPYKTKMRKGYLISLGLVILMLLLCLPGENIISGLLVLLIVSPLMAIFYLVTCIRETKALTLDAIPPVASGQVNA